MKAPIVSQGEVRKFTDSLFGEDLHGKRSCRWRTPRCGGRFGLGRWACTRLGEGGRGFRGSCSATKALSSSSGGRSAAGPKTSPARRAPAGRPARCSGS